MNERIQELLKQAGGIQYDEDSDELTPILVGKDLQKFAEMLVLECTYAVQDGTKEGDWYAQKIEEHFDNSPAGVLHFGVDS